MSDPEVSTDQRFPLVGIVPVSSVVKRRVRRVFGKITLDEMGRIEEGLALFLGLGERLQPLTPPQ